MSSLTKKQQQWLEKIEECDRSGLSIAQYCKEHNVEYKKMVYYRHYLAQRRSSGSFIEVPVPKLTVPLKVCLLLPNQYRIELEGSQKDVASLIRELAS
jgi:hypothetical protein